MTTFPRLTAALCTLALLLVLISGSARAQDPVVKAVLFYSPTCPHCKTVITEVLPPLQNQYGSSLVILGVNTSESEGSALFHASMDQFGIPVENRGVPALIVADQLLVGSGQIPQEFPGIIDAGLDQGGIPWPDLPGLSAYLGEVVSSESPVNQAPGEDDTARASNLSVAERFRQDPAGNTLAVIVLFAMLAVLAYTAASWRDGIFALNPDAYSWLIPVLAVIGLGVSVYLSFVEVTQTEAVCGPVGNCNAVQQSPYARLFGLIPIGLLGAGGYTVILAAWLVRSWTGGGFHRVLTLGLGGMASAGLLFSIYLTFLEPFVIGATCLWCITSALVMTGLFLTTADPALAVLRQDEPAGQKV